MKKFKKIVDINFLTPNFLKFIHLQTKLIYKKLRKKGGLLFKKIS